MEAQKITSQNSDKFLESTRDGVAVIFFDAPFTDQGDIVNNAIQALSNKFVSQQFSLASVDAEENHEFATKFSVVSLPSLVVLHKNKVVKTITDFEPSKLTNSIENELIRIKATNPQADDADDNCDPKTSYYKNLTTKAPIMVFMKGDPSTPRCGFSKQLVELLKKHDIKYDSFNILEDENVRQGLKEYSNWPTYPQIYANGEFVGGLDILKQLEETGELDETLKVN